MAGAAADPAMDMWALGAIAFEIFTAQGLFSRKSYTDNDVINMLLGFDRLPSESQPAFWRQIRDTAAQRLVQNLLRRVPEQRSTINEVWSLATNPPPGPPGRGLLLGTEASAVTPSGVDFVFFSFSFSCYNALQ